MEPTSHRCSGAFIKLRVTKAPVVFAFLGSYHPLITLTAFGGNRAHVAELYRAPDPYAALFFAMYFLRQP